MEIIKIPIVDYFMHCLESAYDKGYAFVMCYLAREADANKIYDQISYNWYSLNDLTGRKILFVFAGETSKVTIKESASEITDKIERYRKLSNDSIYFFGNPNLEYSSNRYYYNWERQDRTHQTASISNLRDYFKLSEQNIPSLVIVPTKKSLNNRINTIKITNSNNLYNNLKQLIEKIEKPLNTLSSLISNNTQSKNEKVVHRYNISKTYLDNSIDLVSENDKKIILSAMKNVNYNNIHKLERETRSKLQQYVDLKKQYPEIDAWYEKIRPFLNYDSEQREKKIDELYNEVQTLICHFTPTIDQGEVQAMNKTYNFYDKVENYGVIDGYIINETNQKNSFSPEDIINLKKDIENLEKYVQSNIELNESNKKIQIETINNIKNAIEEKNYSKFIKVCKKAGKFLCEVVKAVGCPVLVEYLKNQI